MTMRVLSFTLPLISKMFFAKLSLAFTVPYAPVSPNLPPTPYPPPLDTPPPLPVDGLPSVDGLPPVDVWFSFCSFNLS